MMTEIGREGARGRWVGLHQGFFFLGAAGGPFVGGLLTDGIGYHGAMGVAAGLTLAGAFVALACLPEVETTAVLAEKCIRSRTDVLFGQEG